MKADGIKYKQILKTAKALFWKHGIKRVKIEEICTEAIISKKTFYKHLTQLYSNSQEMIKEIMYSFFYGILPTKTDNI
ncbi:MAG: TetR/AcrR family transcriptional regulator [Bacteroidota bacterium]|nr:TetR/AcrR family transcriptional regulator [Bacteroidota bacterium]